MINEKFRPLNNDDIWPNSSFYSKKDIIILQERTKAQNQRKLHI